MKTKLYSIALGFMVLKGAFASLSAETVQTEQKVSNNSMADTQNFACQYPVTEQISVINQLHGQSIEDCYQWLEYGEEEKVKAWTAAQNQLTQKYLQQLPKKEAIIKRLNELSRYEDRSYSPVLKGDRQFIYSKKPSDDKWVLSYQDQPNGDIIELINPNQWEASDTLEFASPSRDGAYLAFAKAKGGNERPVIQIMEVATKKILPDTLKGTKQGWPTQSVSWMPDNEGFYYSANPGPEELLEKEYWNSVYYHQLGTKAEQDKKIFFDSENKEQFHSAAVTEDGRYLVLNKSRLGMVSEVYLMKLDDSKKTLIPLATGFDAYYGAIMVGDKILIMTDKEAPNYKVYITDVDHLDKKDWKLFLPEQKDRLMDLEAIGGRIYANYLHHASTEIKVYELSGKFLHNIQLPMIGTASVSGYWSKPEVWLDFSSFAFSRATYIYHPEDQRLELNFAPKIPFDPSKFTIEQVWYPSKDGTLISMFVLYPKTWKKQEPIPFLLTGYGGFDISLTPSFSDTIVMILEAGGGVAIPNLRGGGEYGQDWHRAGKLENKQNVFDDFIAAAKWLINHHFTASDRLAIRGGSNGGLLVGAAMTQQPDLFKAVLCEVPLLDMLRYHQFGFANIWKDEYGTSDNPDQFKYLLLYSPYHCLKQGVQYPTSLIVAGENDGRVDPFHAKKMIAKLQEINPDPTLSNPLHLLLVETASGHGGGTTLTAKIEQRALRLAFLMSQIGL